MDRIHQSLDLRLDDVCESFLHGKMTMAPFTGNGEKGDYFSDIIQTGFCKSFRTVARLDELYLMTLTNDFTRYGDIYLIILKSESF